MSERLREAVEKFIGEQYWQEQKGYVDLEPLRQALAAETETKGEVLTPPQPYRVIEEELGCEKCGHGKSFSVNYEPPDEEPLGGSETWDNESPAEDMAEECNIAFARGWRAALAATGGKRG